MICQISLGGSQREELVKKFLGGFLVGLILLIVIAQLNHRSDQPAKTPPSSSPEPALTPAEHLAAAKQMLKAKLVNANQVVQAESHLNAIKESDAEYKESRAMLKTVKVEEQRLIKELALKLRKDDIASREQWADQMERGMLLKGFDVHIMLSGADKTIMTMRYALLSRPTVYQLQESDFFDKMKKVGFKKAILTDGYNQSWIFDLSK
jgi:hypothetical protein